MKVLRISKLLFFVIFVFFGSQVEIYSQVNIPYKFASGTPMSASQMNENFSLIASMLNSQNMIGQVIYSILAPDQLYKLLGTEQAKSWVLMDGRSIEGTKLFILTGMLKVPDARGMFIRGMNMSRTDGDPEGNRTVGSYQGDMLREHAHSYVDSRGGPEGSKPDGPHGLIGSPSTTGATGGTETRPENISLYVYIKVD